MEVFHCDQRSDEWYALRAGIPTSSEFATVLAEAKGKDGKKTGTESRTRMTYMRKLAGEIVTGEPMWRFQNEHMERGRIMEAEARELYAFMNDIEPAPVGFIRNGDTGASPDSLLGDNGVLEIKTKLPHLLIEVILKDEFPPEHKAQCQGQLWVAERDWLDLAIYWPKLPLFVKRVVRDDAYIKTLAEAVEKFNGELFDMVETVLHYRAPSSVLTELDAG